MRLIDADVLYEKQPNGKHRHFHRSKDIIRQIAGMNGFDGHLSLKNVQLLSSMGSINFTICGSCSKEEATNIDP